MSQPTNPPTRPSTIVANHDFQPLKMLERVVRDHQASHCAGDKAEDEGADHAASCAEMDLSGMTVLSTTLFAVRPDPAYPSGTRRNHGRPGDLDPDRRADPAFVVGMSSASSRPRLRALNIPTSAVVVEDSRGAGSRFRSWMTQSSSCGFAAISSAFRKP
jgi:hypothetical protein